MRIKLKVGTIGAREEFEYTYTREFLSDKGLILLDNGQFDLCNPCAVHTKRGWVGSFNDNDVLLYLGHGTWDLKQYKPNKDKEV